VLLKDLTMAAFAAELLSSEDTNAAVSGMQIAETLMQKLPDIFRLYFTREVSPILSVSIHLI
jgi:E3 ubiquitin-protein ligase TRIP12